MLFTLLAFAVALGLLITFHELGHYWVARLCGVKVLRFSVGFGRVLLRRYDRHGTEWALSAIPLGGYVKMLDDPLPANEGDDNGQAFNNKSVWQRFAIVLAGPLANLLLAVVLYALLGVIGLQEPAPVLAQPQAQTPAAHAGVQAGDRVSAVNGTSVQSWIDVRWNLLDIITTGGTVALDVETANGLRRERTLTFSPGSIEPDGADPIAQVGLSLAMPQPRIGQVTPGSSAERAGLKEGDLIVAVGSRDEPTATELINEIQRHAEQPLQLTVLREGIPVAIQVTPTAQLANDGVRVGRIGVLLGAELPMVTLRYGLGQSISRGVVRTADTVWFSLKMMGRMVTGAVSTRNISGPVTIADYAGQTARMGLTAYIGFLALISVSIGVLNLLPIPMLDGGHLMYYIIEMLRGKPAPQRWLEAGQRVGLALLMALMGLAFFNDFTRLFS